MALFCTGRVLGRGFVLLALGALANMLLSAQVGPSSLRAVFGQPIRQTVRPKREIFRVSPGFDLTVSYSGKNQVCTIDIASGVADSEQVSAALERAVPFRDRGNLWNTFTEFDGLAHSRNTYYEKVIVMKDIFLQEAETNRPAASILFKHKECGWQAGQDPFDVPPPSRGHSGG